MMTRTYLRLRRCSEITIGVIAGGVGFEVVMHNWGWAAFFAVALVFHVTFYVWIRKMERTLLDIHAHHEWLRWKANQQ